MYSIFIRNAGEMTSSEWNFPSIYASLFIYKISTGRMGIFLHGKSKDVGDYRALLNSDNSLNNTWYKIPLYGDYYPITGGTLNGNNVRMQGTYVSTNIQGVANDSSGGHHYSQLETVGEIAKSAIRINVETSGGEYNEKSALQFLFAADKEGTYSFYNVYSTANITKGTSDLTAGTSALATNSIHVVYE